MDNYINLGSKIRTLRAEKKMSISALAEKASISSGLISQIERDMVIPTITTLWKISTALEVNISYFFLEESKIMFNPVTRKNEHKKLLVGKHETLYEMLTSNPNRKIDLQKVTLKSKTSSSNEMYAHEGEECIYVIKGTVKIKTSSGDYILNEGDSIEFSSTIPHRYMNESDNECILICAMTAHTW